MVRKQVYITEQEERQLKKYARKRRVTQAFLIRDALGRYFSERPEGYANPLDAIIGIGKGGPKDGAINHDHYLYGVPKKQP